MWPPMAPISPARARLGQASNGTRSTAPLAARYLEAYRYLAKAVPASSRLDGVSFTHHQAVASLPEGDPRELLERPDKSKASA